MISLSSLVKIAKEEALKSIHHYKIGVVIYDKNRVLSKGYNHPNRSARKIKNKFKRYPTSLHAELAAVLNARRSLKGASMLIVRVNKSGTYGMAKPCNHCMMYLKYVGIKLITFSVPSFPYYATEDV
jgi:deoxycytidylate deaminase